MTPSGDNKTVANDSQDWANSSLEIPSWLYSCIGWSSLLNHLTDGISFTLHCCWRRFVLSKTLLQLPIPDRSKYTEGVVGNKKWCNYDVTVSNGVNLCDPVTATVVMWERCKSRVQLEASEIGEIQAPVAHERRLLWRPDLHQVKDLFLYFLNILT